MRIAIVEDNAAERDRLINCLNRYSKEQSVSFELSIFTDGIEIVDNYSGKFDMIYFDVEMPFMDGMTAAKKIRALDNSVIIIFLTNYVQWAIDGYTVNASDFLLKPIDYFNFSEHLKKILAQTEQNKQETYTLKTNAGVRKLLLADIFYVESEGHYIHFHSRNGSYSILDSMKNVESNLKEHGFFRCNNCYLVNLRYVQAIEQNIVHVDNYSLQISRPRKKDFLAALTNYLGTGGN